MLVIKINLFDFGIYIISKPSKKYKNEDDKVKKRVQHWTNPLCLSKIVLHHMGDLKSNLQTRKICRRQSLYVIRNKKSEANTQ